MTFIVLDTLTPEVAIICAGYKSIAEFAWIINCALACPSWNINSPTCATGEGLDATILSNPTFITKTNIRIYASTVLTRRVTCDLRTIISAVSSQTRACIRARASTMNTSNITDRNITMRTLSSFITFTTLSSGLMILKKTFLKLF